MFRIDEGSSPSSTLDLCNSMECECGLSRGFRTIDLDDTTLRISTTEGIIEGDRSRTECFDIEMRFLSELHDGSSTELFLDHGECGCEGFFAVVCHTNRESENIECEELYHVSRGESYRNTARRKRK